MSLIIPILLVDDHPLIIDAYTISLKLFEKANPNYTLEISSANCCQSASELLKKNIYSIAFLDVRLPPSNNKKLNSGEDLALYLKNKHPQTKIVMITGHYDALTLGNILQNINPISLLFKGDVNQQVLSNVLKSIKNDTPYYSDTVLKLLRKNISSNIFLDKTDKILLLELSKGKKTKELSKIVPLSIGGIEKRKRQLKVLFGTTKLSDIELVNSAIEKGFL